MRCVLSKGWRKMARNKFALNFDGFLALAEQLDELQAGALKNATENALKATDDYVTTEVDKAVAKSKFNFDRTGKTKASIDRDKTVEWEGTKASAKAGFRINSGGLSSVFLMYGTPHIAPDQNLRKAAKGEGKHKKAIQEIQAAEFNKVIEEVMKQDD